MIRLAGFPITPSLFKPSYDSDHHFPFILKVSFLSYENTPLELEFKSNFKGDILTYLIGFNRFFFNNG